MKKIFGIFTFVVFVFVIFGMVVYAGTPSNIKYNVTVKQISNSATQTFPVYQKGVNKKVVLRDMVMYMNTATNEYIVYTPETNTAVKVMQPPTTDLAQNDAIMNDYKKSYTKVGNKMINGYTCTVYKNVAKNIEACVSEMYGLPISVKTPQVEMQVSSIYINSLTDSDFKLPAGVQVQNISGFMPSN